jgi:hypothetical protein
MAEEMPPSMELAALEGWASNPGVQIRDRLQAAMQVIDGLRAEVNRLHSWAGVMSLLDEHYPDTIFPTLPDREGRDDGPRIVSLLRTFNIFRHEIDAHEGELGDMRAQLTAAETDLAAANAALDSVSDLLDEARVQRARAAYARMEDDRDSVRDMLRDATGVLDMFREQRDLAIAHDRQPYPTADAYEVACAALEKHRARADKAEAELARYTAAPLPAGDPAVTNATAVVAEPHDYPAGFADGRRAERAKVAEEIADRIERELVCCNVFELGADHSAHQICYWGGAAAALAREHATAPTEVQS